MSSNDKAFMIKALKEYVVKHLRDNNFKGSFPHFRRINSNHIDLVTFQFNRYGGSFVIELANCPKDSIIDVLGNEISPNKVTAYDLSDRVRLNQDSSDNDTSWFDYENFEEFEQYEELAKEILALLHVEDREWIKSMFK